MTITKIQSEGLAKPVDLADNEKIRLGTDNDFELYHNGSGAYIQNKTGTLYIASNVDDDDGGDIRIQPKYGENSIVALDDGAVELYYDNVKTFATKSGGNTLTGTDSSGNVSLGRFYYKTEGGTVKSLFDPNGGKFQLYDSVHGTFGNSHDLSIYHDGSNSYIANATGGLRLSVAGGSNQVQINKGTVDEQMARFIADGAVELYYNNTKRFETLSTGAKVTGQLNFDDGSSTANTNGIGLGSSQDARIFHDGSSLQVRNTTGPVTLITPTRFQISADSSNDTMFKANQDGAVELYYDNSKKLETASGGVNITNSGAIYLGGTGSSNALYDYEKGTFTPRFHGQGNNNTITTSTNIGEYVKVGRLVYVKIRVIFSDRNGANSGLAMDGLPFSNAGNHTCTNLGRWANVQNHSVVGAFSGHIGDGSQEIEFNSLTSTGVSSSDVNQTTDSTTVMLSFSYPAWGQ